jgi:hypothetical protein
MYCTVLCWVGLRLEDPEGASSAVLHQIVCSATPRQHAHVHAHRETPSFVGDRKSKTKAEQSIGKERRAKQRVRRGWGFEREWRLMSRAAWKGRAHVAVKRDSDA